MAEFDMAELMEAYRRKWEEHRAREAGCKPAVYKCSYCKDTGFLDLYPPNPRKPAEGKIGTVIYCPYCRTNMLKDISGIIAEYRELDISRFPWETYQIYDKDAKNVAKLKQLVESFVYDFRKWQEEGFGLYIYSETKGSGKTMAASAICGSICTKYNVSARFSKFEDFYEDTRKNYDSRTRNELSKTNVRKYFDAELLVLDDLGVSKITEGGKDALHTLINERYKTGRLCIITSNFAPSALPVHAATIDRINDMCMVLRFPEVPVRARKTMERQDKLMQHINSYDKFTVCDKTPFEGGANK